MDTPYEMTPEEEALYNMTDEELREAMKNEASNTEQSEDNVSTEDSEEFDETEDVEADTEDSIDDEDIEEEQPEVEEEEATESDNDTPEKDSDGSEGTIGKKHKVKANGMEFEFSDEELVRLAPKAMDYTKKMQEIAPWRRTISAMQEHNLSENDINLLIEAKQGNKAAMAQFLKQTNIDVYDLDLENKEEYAPKQYGKNENELALDEVVNTISKDAEFTMTKDVVDRQWDSSSRKVLAEQPNLIVGLHNDIKTGLYAKVMPEAMKLKMLDNGRKSDIEYYVEAGMKVTATQESNTQMVQEANNRANTQANIKQASSKRKAAALPKNKAGKKTVVDYLSEDDSNYNEWYKKTMSNI